MRCALDPREARLCRKDPRYVGRASMSSSGSSSSTSEDSLRCFLDYLGVDERKLESAVRLFEEVANRAEALLVALTPFVERAFASLVTLSEAPEAPGYERLFQERLRYQALMARLTARAAHHLGQLLANEINEGRRVRSIIEEIAKRRECSALVISRRARKLRNEMQIRGGANCDRQSHLEGRPLMDRE